MTQSNPSLYLRCDGTLLLAHGDNAIEVRLAPEQLLQLGVDSLRVATALQPRLMDAAAAALAGTCILPMESAQWSNSTIN